MAEPGPGDPTTGLPYANPPLGLGGRLRTKVEDFKVWELTSVEPSGEGAHWLLRIRKIGCNTTWVSQQLARAAGVRPRDVGYAGRKDRHAIAEQWFSVPASGPSRPDFERHAQGEFAVIEYHRHHRKLRRGALRGNRFVITIRELSGSVEQIGQRIALIRERGVPNYFGPQRFGRDGANLVLASQVLANPRARFRARDLGISAARSFLFNAVLARRIGELSWETLEVGDVANLSGSHSVFRVQALDEDLSRRLAALEIHPTAPLFGRGETLSSGRMALLESAIADEHPDWIAGLDRCGVKAARRSTRLMPEDLCCTVGRDHLTVEFALTAGSFATSVIRELVDPVIAA